MTRISPSRTLTGAFALLLALSSGAASAGDLFPPPGPPSPTMKRLDRIDPSVCIDSLPFVITAPGNYRVCASLTGAAGQTGITILASDVTLDGDGRTLAGAPGSLDGILVEGNRTNVRISNLTLRNWGGHGLHAAFSDPACDSVRCDKNGGDGFRIRQGSLTDCAATGNGGNGVNARGGHRGHITLLKRCDLSRNAGAGLAIVPGVDDDCDGAVDDCVLNGNGGDGVLVEAGTATGYDLRLALHNNRCDGNTGYGVHFAGAASSGRFAVEIDGIRASSNTAGGMRCAGGSGAGKVNIQDFHFVRNNGHGLHVTCADGGGLPVSVDVDARGGTVHSNTGDGVLMRTSGGGGAGKATFKDFSLYRNGGSGIDMNCPASIEQCDSSNNGSAGVRYVHTRTGHVTLMKRVIAGSNGAGGILVSSDDDDTTLALRIEESVCASNNGPGIAVTVAHERVSSSVHLHACDVSNNDGSGLLIVPVAMDKGLRFRAQSSSFVGNAGAGIEVSGADAGAASVSACDASGNGGTGLALRGDSLHVERCTASGNGGDGIALHGSGGTVCDNTASSNKERGITISTTHVEYATNRCSSNGGDGIEVAAGSGNVLRGNFVSGNTGNGVSLRSNGNRLYENAGGEQSNPLYEQAGTTNDTSSGSTAAASGLHNVGF